MSVRSSETGVRPSESGTQWPEIAQAHGRDLPPIVYKMQIGMQAPACRAVRPGFFPKDACCVASNQATLNTVFTLS